MRQAPLGNDLLMVARDMLREELLPHLPPAQRHAAMMVASAMAIAARQFGGDAQERGELRSLESLLGDAARTLPATDDVQARLAAGNALLCRRIRNEPNDALLAGVLEHLLATTRQAVAESNPKYLNARAAAPAPHSTEKD